MEGNVFKFPIRPTAREGVVSLNDLLGYHLKELLRLLVPVSGEEAVKISGYQLLNDPDVIHALPRGAQNGRCEPADLKDFCEPRLGYIKHLLESLSPFIDFEAAGQVVRVDGFRLKNLSSWLVPGGGASDILAAAASRCNLRCRFCYNEGAPKALRSAPGNPEEEYGEILTRIEQYVPQGRLHVFPGVPGPCETLAHPHIVDILRALRDKTAEPLRIATNGSLLTSKMIGILKELKPLSLDLSLNSASIDRRQYLMRDPHPQVAIDSPNGLADAEIPFSIVVVPWPFPSPEIMLEDLAETVAFADARQPTFIQISLPGYSRFFSETALFNHDEVWNSLRSKILQLRELVVSPLIIRPGLFEEYEDPKTADMPTVIGVVRNSPAARAGLQRGDKILRINGLAVKNRHQARSLLTILHQSALEESSLTVKREGVDLAMKAPLADYAYPYDPRTATHLGAVFSSAGIPAEWMESLQRSIIAHRARNVLVLTSRLVAPTIKKLLTRSILPSDVAIHVSVPENHYWGGNIFMGDLMVVQDFIDAVQKFVDEEVIFPDLVVIPSSPFHLSGWGRDLTGRVYLDIEKETGIPVALVECNPLFD